VKLFVSLEFKLDINLDWRSSGSVKLKFVQVVQVQIGNFAGFSSGVYSSDKTEFISLIKYSVMMQLNHPPDVLNSVNILCYDSYSVEHVFMKTEAHLL